MSDVTAAPYSKSRSAVSVYTIPRLTFFACTRMTRITRTNSTRFLFCGTDKSDGTSPSAIRSAISMAVMPFAFARSRISWSDCGDDCQPGARYESKAMRTLSPIPLFGTLITLTNAGYGNLMSGRSLFLQVNTHIVLRVIDQLQIRQNIFHFQTLEELVSAHEPGRDLCFLQTRLQNTGKSVIPDCIVGSLSATFLLQRCSTYVKSRNRRNSACFLTGRAVDGSRPRCSRLLRIRSASA